MLQIVDTRMNLVYGNKAKQRGTRTKSTSGLGGEFVSSRFTVSGRS